MHPGGSRLPSCCFIAFRRGCGWEQGGMDVAGLGITRSAKQGQRRAGEVAVGEGQCALSHL